MTTFDQHIYKSHVHSVLRIVLDILLIVSALIGPWWLALLIALILIFFFGAYEALLAGLLLDSMYNNGSVTGLFGAYRFTIILCISISISSLLAPYVKHTSHHV